MHTMCHSEYMCHREYPNALDIDVMGVSGPITNSGPISHLFHPRLKTYTGDSLALKLPLHFFRQTLTKPFARRALSLFPFAGMLFHNHTFQKLLKQRHFFNPLALAHLQLAYLVNVAKLNSVEEIEVVPRP